MYFQGNGVLQDYEQAVRWYQKSADQGDSGAQVLLGVMCSEGKGVLQNHIEAGKWYRRAAQQGNSTGQHLLALMYEKGRVYRKIMFRATCGAILQPLVDTNPPKSFVTALQER